VRTCLQGFRLSQTGIHDDSLGHVAPLLPRMRYLDLPHNAIALRDAAVAAALATSRTLEFPLLAGNNLGDRVGCRLLELMREPATGIAPRGVRGARPRRPRSGACSSTAIARSTGR